MNCCICKAKIEGQPYLFSTIRQEAADFAYLEGKPAIQPRERAYCSEACADDYLAGLPIPF